jgi:CRISPR/Cas system-associated exonuclease Cas4 (RecB family)
MKTIRASDIGTYIYCQRAWWFQQRGYEPSNQAELNVGTQLHTQHSRKLLVSNCLQILAYFSLLLALVLLVIYLVGLLL